MSSEGGPGCGGTSSGRSRPTRSTVWARWWTVGSRCPRATEGERIARARPGATVLIQVAFSTDAGRPGCEPDAVGALAGTLRGFGLDVTGLMAVAPRREDEARAAFDTVVRLADDLGLAERSIGMTEDLELAVAAGSTMIRVGRALFGDRPSRAPLRAEQARRRVNGS